MAVSGLYFVPTEPHSANTLANVLTRLKQTYENTTQLGRWSLEHTLLRSIPASTEDKNASKFQHILTLSHHPGKTYVGIVDAPQTTTKPPSDEVKGEKTNDTFIAIPYAQKDSFLRLLIGKLNTLWAARQNFVVKDGTAYTVGEFVLRIGEVRTTGNPSIVRGVVVCIEIVSPEKEMNGTEGDAGAKQANGDSSKSSSSIPSLQQQDENRKATQGLIQAMWKEMGIEGAREVMSSSENAGNGDDAFAEVAMWCEAMRLRT